MNRLESSGPIIKANEQLLERHRIRVLKIRNVFFILLLSVLVLHCIIWPAADVVIGSIIVIVGATLGLYCWFRYEFLVNYPISILMLLGYLSYYFLFPPLITMVEGKSLVNNLENPMLVFLNAFICLVA